MDPVLDIKARLPIETLVGEYCHLQKKGRGFVCLCPFHKDTHPSLMVSPDKGIAYCFACQKGGDIFSFYQSIEGVDFREALRDLGDKVGVDIGKQKGHALPKGEKEEVRLCLDAGASFFCRTLKGAADMRGYLRNRGVSEEEEELFGIGFAPDGGRALYEHLLKEGFARTVINTAGLAMQRDLKDDHMRDYFRYRIMFPIQDVSGRIIGFGGRAMRDGDPKYINSPDSSLYRKSAVLFNLHRAKEYIREKKEVILVEGYFDVLAVWRSGYRNVIAQCGTALTEEHVRMMGRYADTVILLLDQDRAGREAAERACMLLSREGLHVRVVLLPKKDPADLAKEDIALLKNALTDGGIPYLHAVFREWQTEGSLCDAKGKRRALHRLAPLIMSLPSVVEREHYITEAAALFATTPVALQTDIARAASGSLAPSHPLSVPSRQESMFSTIEIALGLLVLYPQHQALIKDLIEPMNGLAKAIYEALCEQNGLRSFPAMMIRIPEVYHERMGILQLFCEQYFGEWTESLAIREIKRNIRIANQDAIRLRQKVLQEEIARAKKAGGTEEIRRLEVQYQEIIKLRKMACCP